MTWDSTWTKYMTEAGEIHSLAWTPASMTITGRAESAALTFTILISLFSSTYFDLYLKVKNTFYSLLPTDWPMVSTVTILELSLASLS